MRSRLRALIAGVVLAVASATPAVALETDRFGIDVVNRTEDSRLHIDIAAGETSRGQLKVWNKHTAPVTLKLTVVPASVDRSGSASIGGDDEAVAWVSVEPKQVTLAPGASRTLEVEVNAPRKLDGETKTVAVMAEPVTEGEAPAVLQRLAVTTFLEPDDDSLIASLGVLPWIAGGVLLVVAFAVARSTLARRRKEP